MHVYDFFTDKYQYQIKDTARERAHNNRFENAIAIYTDLILNAIDNLNVADKTFDLPEDLRENKGLQEWFKKLAEYTFRLKEDIKRLLEDIYDCYLIFVRGKHYSAVIKMHDVLEKHSLLDLAFYELLGGFFRIIQFNASDNIFQENFNYHLPYSSRNKVGNQRFSFSGIPILYLGGSVIDCYYEYNETDLNSKNFAITFFGFDPVANRQLHPHKSWSYIESKDRIFDITNQVFDIIHDVFYQYIKEEKTLENIIIPMVESENLICLIKKFILSQVCTFKKISFFKDQSFYEEYVIPQLVTEAIRLHKYDGILYPSTKFLDKNIGFLTPWQSNLYKTNLAMFTEYDRFEDYDINLIKNFSIFAKPLRKINEYNFIEIISNLKSEIERVIEFLYERGESEIRRKYIVLIKHVSKKLHVYEDLFVNNVPYLETFAGKADFEHLREYCIAIFKLVHVTYHSEIESEEAAKEAQKEFKKLFELVVEKYL